MENLRKRPLFPRIFYTVLFQVLLPLKVRADGSQPDPLNWFLTYQQKRGSARDVKDTMFCITHTRLGQGKTFLLVEHFSEKKKNVLLNPSLREMLRDVFLRTRALNLG